LNTASGAWWCHSPPQWVDLIPLAAVRLRRDVGQVIRAIKAHALLHREQRARDGAGQIVADIARDYEPVRKLMNAIIAEGSGVAVNAALTETIAAVTGATAGMAETEGASAQDIALALKLDKSAARRRLLSARDEGFVVNLEQRRGMPGKYRATGQKVESVNILPLATDLAEQFKNSPSPNTPQKPMPPRHREEKTDISLGDNGGNDGGKPVDGGNPVANGLATVKPLDANTETLPVAGCQHFSGETERDRNDDDLTIPKSLDRRGEVCAECGQPGGVEWNYDNIKVRLHPHCERPWLDARRTQRTAFVPSA